MLASQMRTSRDVIRGAHGLSRHRRPRTRLRSRRATFASATRASISSLNETKPCSASARCAALCAAHVLRGARRQRQRAEAERTARPCPGVAGSIERARMSALGAGTPAAIPARAVAAVFTGTGWPWRAAAATVRRGGGTAGRDQPVGRHASAARRPAQGRFARPHARRHWRLPSRHVGARHRTMEAGLRAMGRAAHADRRCAREGGVVHRRAVARPAGDGWYASAGAAQSARRCIAGSSRSSTYRALAAPNRQEH